MCGYLPILEALEIVKLLGSDIVGQVDRDGCAEEVELILFPGETGKYLSHLFQTSLSDNALFGRTVVEFRGVCCSGIILIQVSVDDGSGKNTRLLLSFNSSKEAAIKGLTADLDEGNSTHLGGIRRLHAFQLTIVGRHKQTLPMITWQLSFCAASTCRLCTCDKPAPPPSANIATLLQDSYSPRHHEQGICRF